MWIIFAFSLADEQYHVGGTKTVVIVIVYANILMATAHKAIDLQVEESGSLQGLQERLEDRSKTLDVLHLSGHATVRDQQPVLLLENDVGNVVYTSPQALAQTFVIADRYPRVVFLSACQTAQTQSQNDVLSFSEQIVQANVPAVLGWALPVGDESASQALAQGADIATAVAFARQQLYQQGSDYWHLLCCYVNKSPLGALVTKGKRPFRAHNVQQRFLDYNVVYAVCVPIMVK